MQNNVVNALTKKRAHFVELRRRAREDADRRIREFDEEIASIDKALNTINDAVKSYLCPVCQGTGTARKMDAAGQMEDVACSACKGTGVKI